MIDIINIDIVEEQGSKYAFKLICYLSADPEEQWKNDFLYYFVNAKNNFGICGPEPFFEKNSLSLYFLTLEKIEYHTLPIIKNAVNYSNDNKNFKEEVINRLNKKLK